MGSLTGLISLGIVFLCCQLFSSEKITLNPTTAWATHMYGVEGNKSYDGLLRQTRETKCSESDFNKHFSSTVCGGGSWKSLIVTCYRYSSLNSDYSRVRVECLKTKGGDLLKLKHVDEHKPIRTALGGEHLWLGLFRQNQGWRWLGNHTNVKSFDWASPTRGPNKPCAVINKYGWDRARCEDDKRGLCMKPANLKAAVLEQPTISLNTTGVVIHESFTATCKAFTSKARGPVVKIEGRYLSNGVVITTENYAKQFFMVSANSEEEYVQASKCGRMVTFNVTLQMVKTFRGAQLSCVSAGVSSEKSPKLKLFWVQKKPELESTPAKLFGWSGSLRKIFCQCKLYLGEIRWGGMALTSDRGCGSRYWRIDTYQKDGDPKPYGDYLDKCAHVNNVVTKKESSPEKGNYVRGTIQLPINSHLIGAQCICLSYDALAKFKDGNVNTTDDPYLTVSPRLQLNHEPSEPTLEVKYHAPGSIAYSNQMLEASCYGAVGTNGSLIWTITSLNDTENIELGFGQPLPNVTDGIEIESSPRALTCPTGWKSNYPMGTCIKVFQPAASWEEAREVCKGANSDLMKIPNERTLNYMKITLKSGTFWIGLKKDNSLDAYRWIDNKEPTEYFWKSREQAENIQANHTCAYYEEGSWFAHDCQETLEFICETELGTFPSDKELHKLKGPTVYSKLRIEKVTLDLKGATIACRSKGPSKLGKTKEKEVLSGPLVFRYARGKATTDVSSRANGMDTYIDIGCSADVGSDGTMSLALFFEGKVKYLYYIDLNKTLTEVKPLSTMKFKDISVEVDPVFGPRIEVTGSMKMTSDLEGSFIMCNSTMFSVNDTFTGNSSDILPLENLTISALKPGADPLLAFLAILAASAIGVMVYTTMSPKRNFFPPGKHEGEEDAPPANQGFRESRLVPRVSGTAVPIEDPVFQPPEEATTEPGVTDVQEEADADLIPS